MMFSSEQLLSQRRAKRRREDDVLAATFQRRRTIGAAAAERQRRQAAQKIRVPRAHCRSRLNWEQHLFSLSPFEFRRMYRMHMELFSEILEKLAPKIATNADKARNGSGGAAAISPTLMLSMTLRWLAGGHYIDIYIHHGVSDDMFYKAVWRVIDAINNEPDFAISFEHDREDWLHGVEKEFSAMSTHQVFRGCVGAVDGWIPNIKCPSEKEDDHPRKFYVLRKGHYGMNVQAVCDANYIFTHVDIQFPGTTGDSLAWQCTKLDQELKLGALGKSETSFFLVGDAAYVNSEYLLIPVPGELPAITEWEDSYNYHLSQLRIVIEQAFGILVRKWGILWRPLECRFDKIAHLITACMRLHNLCQLDRLKRKLPRREEDSSPAFDIPPGTGSSSSARHRAHMMRSKPKVDKDGRPVECLSDDDHRPGFLSNGIRQYIIQDLELRQLRRPRDARR